MQTINITVPIGGDYDEIYEVCDENGALIGDISHYTGTGALLSKPNDTVDLATLNVSIYDGPNSLVRVQLAAADSAGLTPSLVYHYAQIASGAVTIPLVNGRAQLVAKGGR